MKKLSKAIVAALFGVSFLTAPAQAVTLAGQQAGSEVVNFGVDINADGSITTPAFFDGDASGITVSSPFFFFGFPTGTGDSFSASIDFGGFLTSIGQGAAVADPTLINQASLFVDAIFVGNNEGTVTFEGVTVDLANNVGNPTETAGPVDDFDNVTARAPGEFGGTVRQGTGEFDNTFVLNGLFLDAVRTSLAGDGILDFTFTNIGTAFFGTREFRLDGFNVQVDVVPEPATMALLGTGLLGFGLRRRRS